jgi:gliding motility-associated-like protein
MSTNFGSGSGQVDISPAAFLVDVCGNIFVSGWGGNVLTGIPTTNMPTSSNAFQSATDGFNFYLFVLSPNASSFLYGTYFGGPFSREHVDGGTSRFDKKGIVYQAVCAGCGGYDDFPVTPGSWPNTGSNVNHNTQDNNCNQGVFKFDFQASGVSADVITLPNDTVCLGTPINFNNTSTNAVSYLWNFGDGSAVSAVVSPSHLYTAVGSYNVTLIAIDSSGCVFSDTAHTPVVILPPPSVHLGNDVVSCQTPNVLLDAGTSGSIYHWSTGATTQTITATAAGTYWVKIGNGICTASDTINIFQSVKPQLGNDTSLCMGQHTTLSAPLGGTSYQWSTGATSQTINVSLTGQYWVSVNWGACQTKDTINIITIPAPNINLPVSAQICPHDSLKLDPGNISDATYSWSTGAGTQTITIFSGGTYSVTVTNQQCSSSDTIIVTGTPANQWEKKIELCDVEKYRLDAGIAGARYLWSTGDTTQTIDIKGSGTYWVTINNNSCIHTDTVAIDGNFGAGELWFPNSFTPNGDLLNDYFTGIGADINYFQMMIFNRWGQLVFESEKLDQGWNGTFKGEPAEQDVYVWKVKYKTVCTKDLLNTKIGHVSLIR